MTAFKWINNLVSQQQYEMPEEVVLQMTHKDVNLGFFKSRKKEVLALRGGSALTYADHYLHDTTTGYPIAMLSARMQQTLAERQEKGYEVQGVKVHFIVAWIPKDAPKGEKETAVVLADLELKKVNQENGA